VSEVNLSSQTFSRICSSRSLQYLNYQIYCIVTGLETFNKHTCIIEVGLTMSKVFVINHCIVYTLGHK